MLNALENIQKDLFARYQTALLRSCSEICRSTLIGGLESFRVHGPHFDRALINFIECIPKPEQKRYEDMRSMTREMRALEPKSHTHTDPFKEHSNLPLKFIVGCADMYTHLSSPNLWESIFEKYDKALNIEEKIEKYYERGKLTPKYEECIEIIRGMIESKEIDSGRIKYDLESLLDTLKVLSQASFLSQFALSKSFKSWLLRLTAAFAILSYSPEELNQLIDGINHICTNLEDVANLIQEDFGNDVVNKILTNEDAAKNNQYLTDNSINESIDDD